VLLADQTCRPRLAIFCRSSGASLLNASQLQSLLEDGTSIRLAIFGKPPFTDAI